VNPRSSTLRPDWRDEVRDADIGGGDPAASGPDDYKQLVVEKRTHDDKPSLGEREIEFVASTLVDFTTAGR